MANFHVLDGLETDQTLTFNCSNDDPCTENNDICELMRDY